MATGWPLVRLSARVGASAGSTLVEGQAPRRATEAREGFPECSDDGQRVHETEEQRPEVAEADAQHLLTDQVKHERRRNVQPAQRGPD